MPCDRPVVVDQGITYSNRSMITLANLSRNGGTRHAQHDHPFKPNPNPYDASTSSRLLKNSFWLRHEVFAQQCQNKNLTAHPQDACGIQGCSAQGHHVARTLHIHAAVGHNSHSSKQHGGAQHRQALSVQQHIILSVLGQQPCQSIPTTMLTHLLVSTPGERVRLCSQTSAQ